MSVYQVTRVEIQRVSGAGKRDQARLTICAYSAPSTRRKPNTLEREMVGNNCRGQIYSVFSTIMGDAWHANPRIIPIPHRFITHSHCFVPFFSRKRNTPFPSLRISIHAFNTFRVSPVRTILALHRFLAFPPRVEKI